MKMRLVVYDAISGTHILRCRARCDPARRRKPVEITLCRLNREEWGGDGTRRFLVREGRFKNFSLHRLEHATTVGSVSEEMIDWFADKDHDWSFEPVGEPRGKQPPHGRGPLVVLPTFSFREPTVAVEFKLTFG